MTEPRERGRGGPLGGGLQLIDFAGGDKFPCGCSGRHSQEGESEFHTHANWARAKCTATKGSGGAKDEWESGPRDGKRRVNRKCKQRLKGGGEDWRRLETPAVSCSAPAGPQNPIIKRAGGGQEPTFAKAVRPAGNQLDASRGDSNAGGFAEETCYKGAANCNRPIEQRRPIPGGSLCELTSAGNSS